MIINVSNTRSRLARVIDLVVTAIAWLVFGYLLYRGLFAGSTGAGDAPRPIVPEALQTLHTVTLYVIVALVNAAILFAWAIYNQLRFRGQDRRSAISQASDHQLAQSYRVDTATLQQLRTKGPTIVYHDAHGRIADVLPRSGMMPHMSGNVSAERSRRPIAAVAN
ncbi:poly-beta-1,6-N-acetyl-D-glucosamine biosynthesis protein PgaD [Sphingobium aromaticiconvertens]|uniref:poly-beta-1,6-N-acetyl-D-glucosamine biosynthesis protein PgaD n=1 Tax=Sphingobium aromaticiconvertens TaxID=365341 RepID=UPI00301A3BD0